MPETINLNASASILRRLGDELIRDPHTAFFELIKNSYDADATRVEVEFPKAESGSGKLVITDDGSGMTLEEIRDKWARAGGENKIREPLSPLFNRRRQGSKGIGRFSLSKLGSRVKVTTRPRGSAEQIVFKIDFSDFTDDRDFNDMSFECFVGAPRTGLEHGTILELSWLRAQWRKGDIRKIKTQLSHLVDPEAKNRDFQITLRCPDFPDLSGTVENPLAGKHSHCIEFELDGNGSYSYRLEADGRTVKKKLGREPLSCGPVKGVVRYYKEGVRSRDRQLTESGDDSHMGVKVYRDSCRVRPYGEDSDDWLEIKARRARGGGKYYVQPLCIAGSVYISAAGNPELRDATNREAGMIENEQFEVFRSFVAKQIEILNEVLEQETRSESQRQRRRTVKKILDTVVRCLNREEGSAYGDFVARIDRSKKGTHGVTTTAPEGPIRDDKPPTKIEWRCNACDARWRAPRERTPTRCMDYAVNRLGEPRMVTGCGSTEIERSTHEVAAAGQTLGGLISGEYALVAGRQLYVKVDPEMGENDDEFVLDERSIVINGNHPAYKVAEALDQSTGRKFEVGDDVYSPALTIHIFKNVCRAWAELHFKETNRIEDFRLRFDGLQDRICSSIRNELEMST